MFVAKKKTLWPPGSHLVPFSRFPTPSPNVTPFSCQSVYTDPAAGYTPKRPQNQGNPAQATNCYFFCPAWLCLQGNSALHLQMWSPWLCSKFFPRSWSFTSPLPCLCTPGCLLTPVPTSQAGSLVLFHPCLLSVTASALSSTLITHNPIFWISLELLDMLSPCSVLWLSWCTQALASDSWSRSFTSYCYLLPAFFLQAWYSSHSQAVSKAQLLLKMHWLQ